MPNPSRASQESLGIAYADNSEVKMLRPDFIFFSRQSDGTIVADIVAPHGTHLSDSLPKLRGLAAYAEKHAPVYRRIDAVAKIGDTLRILDLNDSDVRQAVAAARATPRVSTKAMRSPALFEANLYARKSERLHHRDAGVRLFFVLA